MSMEITETEKSDELLERLVSFADRCLTLLQALPRNRIGVANFRDQLSRSATSIAANYAEATAPESRRDFASKISKALKEAKESRTWLFLISKRGFFAEQRMKPILDEINAIIRILGKSVSTARKGIADDARPGTLRSDCTASEKD